MKRHILNQSWTRIFLAPDSDPSGGSSGNPGANQGGANTGSGGGTTTNLFEGLDLNDLDPAARKLIEAANAKFTTLQKEKDEAAKKVEEATRNERAYQSQLDQTKAQLQKLTGGVSGQSPEELQKEQQIVQYTATILQKAPGLDPKVARTQGEMMYELLGQHAQQIRQQVGADFAPFAQNLLAREAESAFQEAASGDATGALQDEEIAKTVWGQVTELVKQGQQVTTGVVQNLIGMAAYQAAQTGKFQFGNGQQQQQSSMPPIPQLPNVGRFTNGGSFPQRVQQRDANAPRTGALNADGQKAMNAVLGNWGKAAEKAPDFQKK